MLLIAEIWLTVSAWRSGWGAKALLPWAALFAVVVFINLAVNAFEATPPSPFLFLPLDFALVAALIALKRNPPVGHPIEVPSREPTALDASSSVAPAN